MLSNRTLYDLDIFSHDDSKTCLFDILDNCKTKKGRSILKDMCFFKNISSKIIIQRQEALKYICHDITRWNFSITENEVFYAQRYLESNYTTERRLNIVVLTAKHFIKTSRYYFILSGIRQISLIITAIQKLYQKAYSVNVPDILKELFNAIHLQLNELQMNEVSLKEITHGSPSRKLIFETDKKFRGALKHVLHTLLELYSTLEAYYSLAIANSKLNLCFPEFASNATELFIENLTHPLIQNCIANTIRFENSTHALILTGPNMAGKSSFIKSIGLAYFMSYIGMGISATSGRLPFVDELFTNINIEDDIGTGTSYFFNEVQHLKEVATAIHSGKKILLIADELFKGTNAKDALDCSMVVINGFLNYPDNLYILSTHTTEVADVFKDNDQCLLKYFDAEVKNDHIIFSHKLKDGVSYLRLGMHILKKQNFGELLGVNLLSL